MNNVMRSRGLARVTTLLLLVAISVGVILTRTAGAMEPRPWLCRQIPVFSGAKSMTWRATQGGAGRWIMTFMHYDPAGGHDGFTVVSTREVNGGEAEGMLEPGQYYAVALHQAGGHWICPANASETRNSSPGIISDLCYGEDEGGCDVKLRVGSSDAPPSR